MGSSTPDRVLGGASSKLANLVLFFSSSIMKGGDKMKIKDLTLEDCKVICKTFKEENEGNCAYYNGHGFEYICPLHGVCEHFPKIKKWKLDKEISTNDLVRYALKKRS